LVLTDYFLLRADFGIDLEQGVLGSGIYKECLKLHWGMGIRCSGVPVDFEVETLAIKKVLYFDLGA
jgi:hypothetical protein